MGTPWWLTVALGVLTLAGAIYGARAGARQTQVGTAEQATANAREEWFRRVQWASQLTFSPDARTRTAGYRVLDELAESSLAGPDDLTLLSALNSNEALDAVARDFGGELDEPVVVEHDGNSDGKEIGNG